jgi:hypothetical protein
MHNKTRIGILGSCNLCEPYKIFLTSEVLQLYNMEVIFVLRLYEFDKKYTLYNGSEFDYIVFDNIDTLIIENNNYEGNISSEQIISYCISRNIKIIKTCMLKFPIFPINWSGYGYKKTDFENYNSIDHTDYKIKFKECLTSVQKSLLSTDLSLNIVDFIQSNFNKKLLFSHSLHPTNVLFYEVWRSILKNLNINIDDHKYNLDVECINVWRNPFTTKMVSDLDIQFDVLIDNEFYDRLFFQRPNNLV